TLLERQLDRVDARVSGVQEITRLHQCSESLMQVGQAGREVVAPRIDEEAMTEAHDRLQAGVLERRGQAECQIRELEGRLKVSGARPRLRIRLVQKTGLGGLGMAAAGVSPSGG